MRALIGLLLSFTVVASANAVTPPQWSPLPVACTPSRMVPWQDGLSEENQAACHCPPSEMCPAYSPGMDPNDYVNNDRLPPNVTMKCCPYPKCPAGTPMAGQNVPADGNCNMPPTPPCQGPQCPPPGLDGCPAGMEVHHAPLSVSITASWWGEGPSNGSAQVPADTCLPMCENDNSFIATPNVSPQWPNGLYGVWQGEGVPSANIGNNTLIACSSTVTTNDCLHGSSKVTLANGKVVPIETLKVGDAIRGPSGDLKVTEVNQLTARTDYYRINHFDFLITGEHPLQTKDGWKSANDTGKYKATDGRLEVGDVLVTAKGDVKVESIDYVHSKKPEHSVNVKVEGDAPFYVDGVIVKPFKDLQFNY